MSRTTARCKSSLAVAGLFLVLLSVSTAAAAETERIVPQARDKCPVCGMFVSRYPDFLARIDYRDGRRFWFDGAKDFFFCYLSPQRCSAPESVPVAALWVTDYYSLETIDARSAFFVTGSDVYGPMGRELIPFAREDDAREFMNDHHGRALLRFGQIDGKVLDSL